MDGGLATSQSVRLLQWSPSQSLKFEEQDNLVLCSFRLAPQPRVLERSGQILLPPVTR